MQIGAILMLSGAEDSAYPSVLDCLRFKKHATSLLPATANILGRNLIERTIVRLRDAGIDSAITIPNSPAWEKLWPAGPLASDGSISAWKKAVARWDRQGADALVLLRPNFYSDLDFAELVRFHVERNAAMTQVYAAGGLADVAIVNMQILRDRCGQYPSARSQSLPRKELFYYRGYLNRLRKPADFARLVEDALFGRCRLRPLGTEVASGIWFGDGAEVDRSCVIASPSFIGKGTRIAVCGRVGPGSAIEDNCEIDAGTSVSESWILPGTYVGLGLNVRRSIVGPQRIFHLDRETEVAVSDRRLIGATQSLPLLKAAAGLRSRWQLDGMAG
jgi:hypothetical protein